MRIGEFAQICNFHGSSKSISVDAVSNVMIPAGGSLSVPAHFFSPVLRKICPIPI
jgi:hypothetical protein